MARLLSTRWSHKQIARVLHTSVDEVRAAIDRVTPPPTLSRYEIAERTLTWARKHHRWPQGNEWDQLGRGVNRWRAYRAFADGNRWGGYSQSQGSTLAAIQSFIVSSGPLSARLNGKLILQISNLTTRRRAIRAYGMQRMLREGAATQVNRSTYGTLWRIETDDDARSGHANWLEVKNATKNKDGTRDTYFLRVPPSMRTAKEAVAWTFGRDSYEYTIAKET